MTPEKQRIAIATACGWTNVAPRIVQNVKYQGDDITVGIWSDDGWIPDYLNDLNAMNEAEKVLSGEQKEQFIFWLNHLHPSADIHFAEKKRELRLDVFDLVHTTAAQRAEAFLRTLGLWQETTIQPQSNHNPTTTQPQ
jgi:hypothetical protein